MSANSSAGPVNATGRSSSGSLVIGTSQHGPAGTYSETRTIIVADAGGRVISQQSITVQASVLSSCTLPAPATSHLDFSAGIHNARPLAGYTLSTTIDGASCSGPATMPVRGAAMTTTAATNGFGSAINYHATASLGSVSTVLATASASQATTALNTPTGRLTISVALDASATPLAAGSYAAMLAIVLEPAN